MTLYRKGFTNDRLPAFSGIEYITDNGMLVFSANKGMGFWFNNENLSNGHPEWFMELVELPTEEQIKKSHGLTIIPHMVNFHNGYAEGFEDGANYILNKLKG